MSRSVRRCSIAFAFVCLACTADPKPGSEAESSESDSGETESDTGETGPLLIGEPTIIHHPKQPMVIDVIAELDAPGTGNLIHTQDDGVAVVLLEPAAGEPATTLHFRVRGLAPASEHPRALAVQEADGERNEAWSGSVTTNEPLPGFIATFALDTADADLVSSDMRLFDITALYTTDASGLALVDSDGITRWYIGDVDGYTDLTDVWSGVRLRPDGSISYTHRDLAVVMNELGEVLTQVSAETVGAPAGFHHDLEELPNGNFIGLSYSFADVDYEGEGTLHVAGDMLYEFTPTGELVWSWNTFDHLDPQRRRDGFFIPQMIGNPLTGQDGHDWTHGNGIVYRAADDTILLSMRHQDWVIAIDHATGEVLWRLGDEGDFTLLGDEYWFFHQHSPEWQPDGSLMLYDNAVGNPERPDSEAHSRAVRYMLDFDAMTATKVWADDDPPFISALAGDADRTSDGHVLRLDSVWTDETQNVPSSRLRELDPERTPNAVWDLALPPGRYSYRAVPISRWIGEPAL